MLAFDVLREQIDLAIAEGVENVVEHPANVVLGIVDDLACLLVPKYRNSDAAIKVSIRGDVCLAQESEAVDWIAGVARPITKGPAPVVTNRVNHRHADSVLETLQIAHNESAACPGTRQRNVEMIPAGDSGIGGRSVRRDQLAEGIFLPLEFAFGGRFFEKLSGWVHDAHLVLDQNAKQSQPSPLERPGNALAGNLNCGRTADIPKCTLTKPPRGPLGFNFVRCRGELTDRGRRLGRKALKGGNLWSRGARSLIVQSAHVVAAMADSFPRVPELVPTRSGTTKPSCFNSRCRFRFRKRLNLSNRSPQSSLLPRLLRR